MSNGFHPAAMKGRMSSMSNTLFMAKLARMERGKKDRLLDRYHPNRDNIPWGELHDHWMRLWENPEAFEGAEFDQWRETPWLTIFQLGVLFGIDYEQAYPEGRNDEWPIPKDERHPGASGDD
ncbi:hypothetical protein [Halomarina oriensis]|uniref:Uncharacterized protein n=1 Tax=Halomarina oriensis TaxID=671145 RepID=A0A6B0GNQ3_9EURY|nr:hypothetical protein [Halomarina oriensis]MWG36556.1 hypothetical protein [Halomarina oriensis]